MVIEFVEWRLLALRLPSIIPKDMAIQSSQDLIIYRSWVRHLDSARCSWMGSSKSVVLARWVASPGATISEHHPKRHGNRTQSRSHHV